MPSNDADPPPDDSTISDADGTISGDGGATSDDDGLPPASIAFRAVPYALPFAAGIAFLVWGVPELDRVVDTYYGDVPHLFGAMSILTVGSVLLLYGIAGALAVVVRDATGA